VDDPASLHFVSVWVPIIAAVLGALVGTIGGAVGPVIAGWLKERLYGRRDNLLDYMLSQVEWYRERERKLNVLAFEIAHDPAPDMYRRQVLVSQLDHHDRQGATPLVMNDNDIGKLREWAVCKAAECRDNAAQLSRDAEQVDNKTLFRF
jgi:hypothetical protein